MRQLLYTSSSSSPTIGDALGTILAQSRRNNSLDDVTGLLWTDGTRFLQVLEGGHDAIQRIFDRIKFDSRHRAIVVLHDRTVGARTFANWSMALASDSDEHIGRALHEADPTIRGTFEGLIATRSRAFG